MGSPERPTIFYPRRDYQQLMRERGVQLESWGPFAVGRNNLLSDPTLNQPIRSRASTGD
jgi:diketogulonate reductase-like aldo/keto reductase